MKHVLESADVLTPEGEFLTLSLEELELGYRTSVVATKGYTVLGATIALEKGNPEEIKAYMDDLKERRITKQPLEYASAGSTFKRPEGYFCGQAYSGQRTERLFGWGCPDFREAFRICDQPR